MDVEVENAVNECRSWKEVENAVNEYRSWKEVENAVNVDRGGGKCSE